MYRKIREHISGPIWYLLLSSIAWADADEYTIIEASPLHQDTQFRHDKDKRDDQEASDAAMLYQIPGLSLTQGSGPLGRSEIGFRGLSDNRLSIDLEGLSLNNPLNGFNDANSLFLFAAKRFETSAQSLLISLPEVDKPFTRGIFGFGSEQTIKAGMSTGAPLGETASFFAATQLSSSNGRFSFFVPDATNADTKPRFRLNNDQDRLQALMQVRHRSSTGGAHVLAAFNMHQGGIPGFAFSPTINLRSKTIFSGLSVGINKNIRKSVLSITLANSFFDHETRDQPAAHSTLRASKHELTIGLDSLSLPEWLDLKLAEKLVVEHAYGINKTRIGGGFLMKRTMTFKGSLKPKTMASFSMMGYHEHGLLFKKELGLSLEPKENISLSARFSRAQRLPTFMEMYADNRFFKGNKDLNKESVWDIEIGTGMSFAESLHIQLAGFMGYLNDVIVYVPFMATQLHPINASYASRYGLDLAITYEPKTWFLLETKNSVLRTRIKATDSPLPQAPPFVGLTRLRLGPPDLFSLSLQGRYKGSSAANVYGTLRSNGYIIFDALFSLPLKPLVNVSLSVNNILNNKTARDSYEMPLPGTFFFGQIELGNS